MSALTRDDLNIIDGDARVSCRRLQQSLGIKRLQDVHRIVDRNEIELLSYGRIIRQDAYKSGPGRPMLSYLFTEEQALLICMFSRTEKAVEARRNLIEVFVAWRRGELGARCECGGQGAVLADPVNETLSASADRARRSTEYLTALNDLTALGEIAQEVTHLPIWPSNRRPNWWHDIEVRGFLTQAHRQMSSVMAEAQGQRRFGERCPRKSSICVYWQRLDDAKKDRGAIKTSHLRLVEAS